MHTLSAINEIQMYQQNSDSPHEKKNYSSKLESYTGLYLCTAKTYEHNMLDETSVVDKRRCHTAVQFVVFVDEDHSNPPTLYWLPELHKQL